MPIYGLVRQEAVFSPEEVSAITKAFEAALQSLGLVNRADPVAETVARKIIDLARMGERDPDRLCDQVLMTYGQSARQAG
jgi:DNA-directed RNA polymerase subunit H (RpoH/RPB5)